MKWGQARPGKTADKESAITGIFPYDAIDPEKIRGWCVGLHRWLADHPIDYDNLHKHTGTASLLVGRN